MQNKKIAIIGCGNLGCSILRGLLEHQDVLAENLFATRRNTQTLSEFATKGINVSANNNEAVSKADIILLTVKPYTILELIESIKPQLRKDQILVSLATGISLSQIRQAAGDEINIMRAMPNTAADVKESVTCICSDSASTEDVKMIGALFGEIGTSIQINEELMNAATVLGACGVAYVLRFIRAMVQGGIEIGFDAKTASQIVNQTVKGAAELLIERGHHPEYEIDKVTTPKGCTIAGLNEMEHNGFSSSLIKGIVTSYEKI